MFGALARGTLTLALATYAFTLEEMNEVFDKQLKQVALTVLAHYESRPRGAPNGARNPADMDAFATQVWTLEGKRIFASSPGLDIPFSGQEGIATVTLPDGI